MSNKTTQITNNNTNIASFVKSKRVSTYKKSLKKSPATHKVIKDNFWCITIDLRNSILVDGVHEILSYLAKKLGTEITYVSEKKIKNNQAHIHGYFLLNSSRHRIQKEFNLLLNGSHYDIKEAFDIIASPA